MLFAYPALAFTAGAACSCRFPPTVHQNRLWGAPGVTVDITKSLKTPDLDTAITEAEDLSYSLKHTVGVERRPTFTEAGWKMVYQSRGGAFVAEAIVCPTGANGGSLHRMPFTASSARCCVTISYSSRIGTFILFRIQSKLSD